LGLFELKHFFSHSITSEQGDRVSTTAVHEIIRRIVANESPGKPISDHSIAMILENQGYAVARRTVAKYRDSLRIPAMHLRRH
jgi:RNA polymerase sigma-54 factor